MASILRMNLLGGLSLTLGDTPITRFISSKSPALLCYLAYTGQPHTRAALTGLLWSESAEAQAKASLRQVLSDLRSGSLAPYLLVEGNTVAFNSAAPHWLDVAEFNRYLQQAAPPPGKAEDDLSDSQAAALQAAVELYRGDFLAGFFVPNAAAFEEWVTAEQEWLRQAVLQALHRLIHHYTRRGAYLMGINAASRLLAIEPWQEEAHRQLMRLLALNGQRAAALAQYETCRRVLAKELGVSPTRDTVALYEQIRSGQLGPGRPAAPIELTMTVPHNLPDQPTSFIGRQAELAELVACLSRGEHRAVTISGASGIGKTRLALAVAEEAKYNYPDGVWYVPLLGLFAADGIPDPFRLTTGNGQASQLLVDEIATAMKLSFCYHADPARQLIDHLRGKRVLLLLDSLRPVPTSVVEFLGRLLAEAPGVVLLITAAGPIGLPSEHHLELHGLPTPAENETQPADYPSVRLFVERAGRAAGDFVPTPADLPVIAAICRLMAGNPLGIELAAAWVAHWPPTEILSALGSLFDERNRPAHPEYGYAAASPALAPAGEAPLTVEAAFQGCWDLLAPAERSVLAQLTVFRGDFSVTAAEAITGAPADILAGLADRLLLQAPAPGRYAMHRLIHRYTVRRLAGSAVPDDRSALTQDRHSTYYLNLLAKRADRLQKRGMAQAMAEIQAEWRHIQQAWEWATERRDVERLQRAANALARYLTLRGFYQTGERLFGQAADALRLAESHGPVRADDTTLLHALARGQLLLTQARFLNLLGDQQRLTSVADAARAQFGDTLAQAEARSIAPLAIASLSNLGSVALLQNNYLAARDHLEAALQRCEALGEPQVEASLLSDLGAVMRLYGDYAAAKVYLERCQLACRQSGDRAGEALACYNLGRVLDALGRYEEAAGYFDLALRLSRSLEDERLEAQTLVGQALLAEHMGNYDLAWEAADRAATLAAAATNRPVEAEALTVSGHALLGLGMAAEATTAFSHALEIYRDLNQETQALAPLAGLAAVAQAQSRLDQALAHVEEILRRLSPPPQREITLDALQGIQEPFRLCLIVARVLRAARRLRARECEEVAYRLLKEQADRISDPDMRRAFMRQVPHHREIIEAHRANRARVWR